MNLLSFLKEIFIKNTPETSEFTQELELKESKISANLSSLMNIYSKNKDFATAKEDLKTLLALNAKNRDNIIIKYAQVCILNKDFDEAIETLLKALDKKPNNEELNIALSSAYEAKYDFEKAIEIIYDLFLNAKTEKDKAKFELKLGVVYSDWGVEYFRREEYALAMEKFMTALKYDTSNPDIYFNLGKLNHRIKNYEQATKLFKKALETGGEDSEIYLNLGYVYEDEGVFDFAQKCYEKAISSTEDNYTARVALATLFAVQEQYQSAIDELKEALQINPNGEDAYYNLALAYENTYNPDLAKICYEKVLEINPNRTDAKNNLDLIINN